MEMEVVAQPARVPNSLNLVGAFQIGRNIYDIGH